jgi:hypothetical protein
MRRENARDDTPDVALISASWFSTSAKTQVVCSLIDVDQALNSVHMSTAQAPVKEKSTPAAQEPVKEKSAPTAQAPLKEKPAPSVAKDETKSGAPAALSAEQHAKIWSRLRGLTNVEFSTTVGGVIPATVHLYRCLFRSWNMSRNIATTSISWSAMKFLSWLASPYAEHGLAQIARKMIFPIISPMRSSIGGSGDLGLS